MREIVSTLEKALMTGLRPEPNVAIGAETLVECYNLVPNAYGLEPRKEVYSFSSEFPSSHPFPYFRKLQSGLYAFTRNGVHRLEASGRFSNIGAWDGSKVPDIADFQDMFFFSGDREGRGYRFFENKTGYGANGVSFSSCIQHQGQLVIGGATIPNNVTSDVISAPNMMAWAKVGSADFSLDFSNEAGYGEATFAGKVLRMFHLGEEIIVYGEDGICKMAAVSAPTPSYKFTHFSDNSILSPSAIAGDNSVQLFVGKDMALYLMQPRKALSDQGYAPKRVGYAEYISKCGNNVCVSHDALNEHWWISGNNKTFILTGSGLGESSVSSNCVINWEGKLYGATTGVGSNKALIKTQAVSFGTRGIKLLTTVEADIESNTNAVCKTYWSMDYRKPYHAPPAIRFDPRGYCFPMLSGSQFQIEIETEDFRSTKLSKLWLKYKVTDKNSVRGAVNAGQVAE